MDRLISSFILELLPPDKKAKPKKIRGKARRRHWGKKTQISVRIHDDILGLVDAVCEKKNLRRTDASEQALLQWVQREMKGANPALDEARFMIYNAGAEEQRFVSAVLVYLRIPPDQLSFYEPDERAAWIKKLTGIKAACPALYQAALDTFREPENPEDE